MTGALVIRPACPEDGAVIFELVRALAAYERLLDQVDATQDMLSAALFSDTPRLFCDLAEVDGQDLWQKAVFGMACVANERGHVEQVLEQALNVIKSMPIVELVRVHRELL